MKIYEPIESKVWRDKNGRTASIYGAVPYTSAADREANRWRIEVRGWTVKNNRDGRVGICRGPFATRQEAQDWCDKENMRLSGAAR